MDHFAVGVVSFALAVFFPILYIVGFQMRRLLAWSRRETGPTDRVGFHLVVAAILGFAVGCFAQPMWDQGSACQAAGQPVVNCVFKL